MPEAHEHQETPEEQKNEGQGWMPAILTVVLLLVVGGCFAMIGGEDEPDEGGGEYGAQDVCEQFVESRLKSPSSAEFNDTATTGGSGTYLVTGAVDSQNGFGAMIRNEYRCKVTHTSGDNWRLIDLEMTSN